MEATMNEEIRRLKREQETVFREMETLRKKVADEKRAYSPEEEGSFDSMEKRFDSLQAQIEREQKMEKRAAQLAADDDDDSQRADPNSDGSGAGNTRDNPEHEKRFSEYIKQGKEGMDPAEWRALQMDSDVSGGYIVAEEQWVNKLLKNVDDQVFLRELATVFPVPTAQSLGVPTLDTDMDDANWTSELGTGSEDNSMELGKRSLYPHPLAKRVKISEPLLRRIGDSLVMSRLAYKFGVSQENAFMTGDGDKKPLGIFVASADGIPTSRDVSSQNTTTALTAEGLINALYFLKPQYLKNSRWLFHRDAMKGIRKIKDATSGQFIWQPGLASDKQPSILDRPYTISEFVPNTFTASQYVGMIADYSYYWIADALSMRIQRLVELYAETNQIGFIGRLETDGQPVLGEAFSRLKLAAS
jgi:HK97 family phage major capsid protein